MQMHVCMIYQESSQERQAILTLVMLWQGYLTALLGNVMLLNYFLGRNERSGATIQAVGIATNVIVLTQVLPLYHFLCIVSKPRSLRLPGLAQSDVAV